MEYEVDPKFYPENVTPEKILDTDLQFAESDLSEFINISKKYYSSVCKITGRIINDE